MRKPGPKSIDDLKDFGYFEEKNSWYDLKRMNFQDYAKFYSSDEFKKIGNRQLNSVDHKEKFKSSNKLTMMFLRPAETRRKQIEYTMDEFDDPFKFATDNIFTMQTGFRVTRNLHFYEAIRDTFRKLFESGLIQFHLTKFTDEINKKKSLKTHQKQEQYSTLTWDQLYPGFYIWLGALAVCFIVFVGEIIVFKIKNIRISLEEEIDH